MKKSLILKIIPHSNVPHKYTPLPSRHTFPFVFSMGQSNRNIFLLGASPIHVSIISKRVPFKAE